MNEGHYFLVDMVLGKRANAKKRVQRTLDMLKPKLVFLCAVHVAIFCLSAKCPSPLCLYFLISPT